jgi:hypothetical protein
MKQGFKLEKNLEQESWLGEDIIQFLVSYQNLGNC